MSVVYGKCLIIGVGVGLATGLEWTEFGWISEMAESHRRMWQ